MMVDWNLKWKWFYDFFADPITSSDVNIFECGKEIFSKSVFIYGTQDMVKVAAIKLSSRNIYIALLQKINKVTLL